MSRIRAVVCCLLVTLAAGCRAQSGASSPGPVPVTPQLNRKIEVLLRSQFEVPPDVEIAVGPVSKSDIAGYEKLPITFTGKGQAKTVNFLLSNDGNTIARLETFDISHNPAETIPTANRPVRGPSTAKVTIINFDDLECPFCAQMHAELFPATADHYKGLVKFIYKDYPLVEIHPWAMHAAVDANCLAGESGAAYWNFVDYVHTHASDITGAAHNPKQAFSTLDSLALDEAKRSGLQTAKLTVCEARQDQSAIEASIRQGDAVGVNGTPTLFVNGERISGMIPAPLLWTAIDRALRAAGVQPPPQETGGADQSAAAKSK